MKILSINSGSSSLKFSLFDMKDESVIASGQFERIGIEFSGKNHATVIHACNKIEKEMKINKDLSDAINNIEKQLT